MRIFFHILLFTFLSPLIIKAQTPALRQQVLKQIAEKDYRPTFSAIAAKLKLDIHKKYALKQLDTLLSKEYGDMFWMYGCTGLYFSAKDFLPDSYKLKIRECWKNFTPYRGDTENHFLMYYSSLYLLSQEWPELRDTDWFMGRSSKEIKTESEEYLNYWINRTVRLGQIEFDSPRYFYYFVTPLVLLTEYSQDTVMKKRSKMMLEYLLVDYATEYLGGNYCGANSRISNEAAMIPLRAEAVSYGEFFFEDSVTHLLPDVAFAAISSFTIPGIIRNIARDRKEPYSQYEIKRNRETIRYSNNLNKNVFKYTFMTKDFALGSLQGGLIQPIQQRSWSLILNNSHSHNVLFGLHPYASEKELGMFFPEEPSFMLEKIDAVKNGYSNENKWVGGSPYETIKQYKNQIECKYVIPRKEKYHHVDIFVPGWGKVLNDDELHKKCVRIIYDSCLVTISPRTPYEWINEGADYRLRLSLVNRRTSYFISCTSIDEFTEFDDNISFYSNNNFIPENKKKDWLFFSDHLESKLGSAILKMKYGADERVLDFMTNTIW